MNLKTRQTFLFIFITISSDFLSFSVGDKNRNLNNIYYLNFSLDCDFHEGKSSCLQSVPVSYALRAGTHILDGHSA